MITPIYGFGGTGLTGFGTNIRYHGLFGNELRDNADITLIPEVIPHNCYFSGLRARTTSALGSDDTVIITVLKFVGDPAVTVRTPVSLTLTQASGTSVIAAPSNVASFAQGDRFAIEVDYRNTSVGLNYQFSLLSKSNGGESIISANGHGDLTLSVNEVDSYSLNVMGGYCSRTAQADYEQVQQLIDTPGTFKNMFVLFTDDIGGSNKSMTFTLYKNGSPTALSCQVISGSHYAFDVTNEVHVDRGDLIHIDDLFVGSVTAISFKVQRISFSFVPDTAGYFPYMNNQNFSSNPANNSTYEVSGYLQFTASNGTDISDALCPPTTVKSMSLSNKVAPGVGETRTYTLQKNDASTGLSIQLQDAETDDVASLDVVFSCDDRIRWLSTRSSSSAANPEIIRIGLTTVYGPSTSCPNPFNKGMFFKHEPSGGNSRKIC